MQHQQPPMVLAVRGLKNHSGARRRGQRLHAILAVAGDITAEEVQTKLSAQLSVWPMGDIPATTFGSAFESGLKTVTIDLDLALAHIILGDRGIQRQKKLWTKWLAFSRQT